MCWCGKESHAKKGEWPDGESQIDSFSFGVVAPIGLLPHYHSTKMGDLPLQRRTWVLSEGRLKMLLVGRLGFLYLVFMFLCKSNCKKGNLSMLVLIIYYLG